MYFFRLLDPAAEQEPLGQYCPLTHSGLGLAEKGNGALSLLRSRAAARVAFIGAPGLSITHQSPSPMILPPLKTSLPASSITDLQVVPC